ncbi:MAG: hypothetical protein AAF710_01605 [Planctomycetota bacterium]
MSNFLVTQSLLGAYQICNPTVGLGDRWLFHNIKPQTYRLFRRAR